MAEQHTTSETTWNIRLDRALDEISFLKDKIKRARYYVDTLMSGGTLDEFALIELGTILEETREDSDLRRFAPAEERVLASTSTNTKEETA